MVAKRKKQIVKNLKILNSKKSGRMAPGKQQLKFEKKSA